VTNILRCIQNLERQTPLPPSKEESVVQGTITLDLRKDPDPYGYHRMSVAYRLRCMGWPEELS
jgi:hypothetical protein